ncbi:hypothetical protein [Rothia sp. CCM 9419]|uniref:hypothetical protein n=1 Tax=Rothia sp. CCM 9419 TaxID=3402662 RepID=UPI003ADC702E
MAKHRVCWGAGLHLLTKPEGYLSQWVKQSTRWILMHIWARASIPHQPIRD